MTRWREVATIARWEFHRFVKWRQQLIGVLVMLGLGGLFGGVGKMVSKAHTKPVDVAVVGAAGLSYPLPPVDGVTWVTEGLLDEAAARAALAADTVDGALLIAPDGSGEVLVKRKSAWTARIAPAFTKAGHAATYSQLSISDAQRRALEAPFAVRVTTLETGAAGSVGSSRLYANVMLGLGLAVLFSGFASLFAGITGEKQQRITEQMLSMVSPQSWIDGKILGLAGAAIVGTVFTAAAVLTAVLLLPPVFGAGKVPLPPPPTDLGLLALIALVTALGTAMWFSFMAAMAATIDDPNSSPRSALLMIPAIPSAFAFVLVYRADATVAQVLSIFPLTSMAVLPVRLLATSVPWWEPWLAVVLLALAAWVFRRAAGKIFAAGVLLHGKEPSLAETLRWARKA